MLSSAYFRDFQCFSVFQNGDNKCEIIWNIYLPTLLWKTRNQVINVVDAIEKTLGILNVEKSDRADISKV